jgi:hypothetical protein
MLVVPVMAAGSGSTVIVAVVEQPVLIAYVTIAVPAEMPVTIPVPAFMVAMAVLLQFHTPPVVVLFNAAVAPVQTLVAPVMGVGNGLTVIGEVVMQPEAVA